MKYTRLFSLMIVLGCSVNFSFGQIISEKPLKSVTKIYSGNIERYGLDYELPNYTFVNGDSMVLNTINLDRALLMREASVDKELYDLNSGLTILIYSEERARQERGLEPIDESHKKRTGL